MPDTTEKTLSKIRESNLQKSSFFGKREHIVKKSLSTTKNQRVAHIHFLRLIVMSILTMLVTFWAAAVIIICSAAALDWSHLEKPSLYWADFNLSDTVLIALIGSTPANLFGAFMLASKWLYAIEPKD